MKENMIVKINDIEKNYYNVILPNGGSIRISKKANSPEKVETYLKSIGATKVEWEAPTPSLDKNGLLSIFKLLSDDITIEKINNVPFIFVNGKQRFILTQKQVEELTKLKNLSLETFNKICQN